MDYAPAPVIGPVDDQGNPRQHLGFADRLAEGYSWQVWLASRLLQEGLAVQIPQQQFLLNPYESKALIAQDEDVVVGINQRVWLEVKAKARDISGFSSLYGPVKSSWDRHPVKPLAVVVISTTTQDVAVMPTKFEDRWTLHRGVYDSVRGHTIDVYSCPRRYLRSYKALVETLREKTC